MQIRNLDHWSAPSQVVVLAAQERAAGRGDLETTPAHFATVLLEMQPVRTNLAEGANLTEIVKACEIALMLTRKAAAKRPVLTPALERLLFDDSNPDVPREVPYLLRGFAVGAGKLEAAVRPLSERADEIGKLFEHPRVREGIKVPSPKPELSMLTLTFAAAARLGHEEATTRHCVRAWLSMLEKNPKFQGAPEVGQRLEELLARTSRRRDGNTIRWSPRLLGALAAAVAAEPREELAPFMTALVTACLDGDEPLAFVREGLRVVTPPT